MVSLSNMTRPLLLVYSDLTLSVIIFHISDFFSGVSFAIIVLTGATIKAPTTIIASANPYGNSEWNDDDKIDIDQIPALKPVLDRFD